MKSSNLIKMKWIAIAAMTALGALAASNVQATQCPLIPADTANMEDSQAADLLENGKFPQLETILEKRHRANLASEGEDLLTLRNISNFLQVSGQQENLMRMWVDERPQSFFAQFSAGSFYSNQAANVRGNGSISDTGSGQLAKMRSLDKMAIEHAQKAMQIDTHSALPASIMLVIAGEEGQAAGKSAAQWLQAAIQTDPKNLAARIQAITFLSPRWGGSFDLLDQMVEQSKKSLTPQSVYYLQYNLVLAKASHEEVITGNKSKAHALYKQAKDMCENSSTAQAGFVRTY